MITINGKTLNITNFPDKTSQVWHVPTLDIPDTNYVFIVWSFENEAEFIHLAQLKTLLDSLAFTTTLSIQYLPYGRQDKDVSNSATFALHTFAHLINSLEFEEVIILDPHSNSSLELIRNSKAVYLTTQVNKIIEDLEVDLVCYPDKGAVSKYTKIYNNPYVYGDKVRDQATGKILSFNLIGKVENKKVLIVDDICDYGNTFIILSKSLLDKGAKEVFLFVTHGLFTGGLVILKEAGIKRIFSKKGEHL